MEENTQYVLATVTLGGFVLQRLIEVFDVFFRALARCIHERAKGCYYFYFSEKQAKSLVVAVSAIVLGTIFACCAKLGFPQSAGISKLLNNPIVFGLLIASGTEGSNALIKILNYLKEERKKASRTDNNSEDPTEPSPGTCKKNRTS